MERPAFEIPPPPPPPPPKPCSECGGEAEGTYGTLPVCNGCGSRLDEERKERERASRREQRERKIRDNYDRLTDRYPRMYGWSFESYPDDDAGKAAAENANQWLGDYQNGDSLNLLIYGPVGVGKTGLAWATMRDLLEDDGSAVDFVNVRQLLAAVRRSFSNPDAPDPLEGLATVNLLVLDDLGAERATDWALETVATLIEDRYQRYVGTIVTANYSPSGLVARLGHQDPIIGQRIVSRLVEECAQIQLKGADRRLAKKAA
jgi:DNA replication protein DnaC